MKHKFFSLILNLILASILICKSLFGQSDVIVPLAVGNYWEFADSTIIEDTLIFIDTSMVGITGKQNIEYQSNNYEVFYWNGFDMNTNPPEPQPMKWLIRNQSDGLWEYGMLNDTDTLLLQNLTLKFPANIGDSWPIMAYVITDTSISVGDTLTMECIDTDQEYITPAGTFNCYVYQYVSNNLSNLFERFTLPSFFFKRFQSRIATNFTVKLFFSPNVGLVGSESGNELVTTRSYLISYGLVSDVQTTENSLFGFQLYQNYPNPFNPSTTIKYSIPVSSNVSLKIFDVLGNEIATLINEYKLVGFHEIELSEVNLPSGIYFYRIISGEYSQTKKMILLK